MRRVKANIRFQAMQQYLTQIIGNQEVSPGYWRMQFSAPPKPIGKEWLIPRAGQFVHVKSFGSTGFDPLLRRAFSILKAEGEIYEILFRAGGRGTRELSRLKAGDTLDVLGPLGQPYSVRTGNLILIGGGVGAPPMAMLAAQETTAGRQSDIQVILGGRSAADVLCVEDFAACGVQPVITTDDGSLGQQGRVTDVLAGLIQSNGYDSSDATKVGMYTTFHVKHTVYACGPIPMLRSVAEMCGRNGVPCQVSLEENMPCGIGVCNGCVVPVVNDSSQCDEFSRYQRVCLDGPALWGDSVDWDRF